LVQYGKFGQMYCWELLISGVHTLLHTGEKPYAGSTHHHQVILARAFVCVYNYVRIFVVLFHVELFCAKTSRSHMLTNARKEPEKCIYYEAYTKIIFVGLWTRYRLTIIGLLHYSIFLQHICYGR